MNIHEFIRQNKYLHLVKRKTGNRVVVTDRNRDSSVACRVTVANLPSYNTILRNQRSDYSYQTDDPGLFDNSEYYVFSKSPMQRFIEATVTNDLQFRRNPFNESYHDKEDLYGFIEEDDLEVILMNNDILSGKLSIAEQYVYQVNKTKDLPGADRMKVPEHIIFYMNTKTKAACN